MTGQNEHVVAQTGDVGLGPGNRGQSTYSGKIVLSHALERSILYAPGTQQSFPAYIVAGRKRQATCSDVAWFRGNHLATVNLYGRHLRIYRLHEDNGTPTRLELLHEKGDVAAPEGVAVSHNGSMLAVSHSLSHEFGVSLQTISKSSFVPGPAEILCKGRAGCAFHGINFSPDGRYLAYTVVGSAPAIEVIRLDGREMTCRLGNFSPPLTPKSIAFSADSRFVLVVRGLNAAPTDSRNTHGGMLTVHRFDALAGSVEVDPVAEYKAPGPALGFVDMSTFLPAKSGEAYRLLVADQGADVISAFSFNATRGTLVPDGVFAENLSFPHGIDARADGRYVAITTYGDDTIHIAREVSVSDTKARLSLETTGIVARKSHVAIIGHHVSGYIGGAERSLLQILAAIDRHKYYVTCILPNGDDVYLQSVAKYVDDIIISSYQWGATVPCDPQSVAHFETIFRDNRVDLVHVNTITLVAPLMAARRLNVPTIVHVRELIDQDEELARMLGSDPLKIKHTIKAQSDFIIANSDITHQLYHKDGRSFRLYNCVDLDRFDLPNDPEPKKLKVGIISNNSPRKGIEDFVKLAIMAVSCRPELEFFVIGPRTEHSDELKRIVGGQSQPVNIHFTGYIADPFDAVRLVNVVVSFSIVAESFGRTISEAMAMRRPVIAYDWGAAPELIRHGQDGFLIPYRDFERALAHLGTLADCPDQALEMGQNGRARAEQLFSSKTFAVELNRIYHHILDVYQPVCSSLMQRHHFKTPPSKMEIIGLLATKYGFRNYLELCTPTTGNCYASLDRQILTTAHRLMYNCPASFEDGFVVDFRSESLDISQCLAEITDKRLRYDIILIDPFHEYETSYRDLLAAFDLIDRGGILVVHDCLPPNAAVAAPKFVPGSWCGVTYKAYLDFVFARSDVDYFTVNADFGCGIILKRNSRSRGADSFRTHAPFSDTNSRRQALNSHDLLRRQWREIGKNFDLAFPFLERHKKELLNLISPEEFLSAL